jgi:hypothetical protein
MPNQLSELKTDTRVVDAVPARTVQPHFLWWPDGNPVDLTFKVQEERRSQGNKGWAGNSPGKGDTGGPFYLYRQTYEERVMKIDTDPEYPFSNWYTVPLWVFPQRASVNPHDSIWPSISDASSGFAVLNLMGKGTTAIARVAPTNPAVDGAVALGELVREGLPKMAGKALKNDADKFKALGSEYLNVEFGWKPFISDLRKLAHVVTTSDDYITQLTRNSGRDVRRRYKFPKEVSEGPRQEVHGGWPGAASGYLSSEAYESLGQLYVRQTTTAETWFSGSFTYHFDLRGSSSWDRVSAAATRARHLYGIKLTPDVLWNLMPWSWALDWGANIGDVMTNVSLFANDGLVMRYGYVMEHRKVFDTYRLENLHLRGVGLVESQQSFGKETKIRLRASPFGFGLSFDGFTPRQLAIITALGITRAR